MIKTYETDLNDVPVTVTYEYEPAEGDGWQSPRFPEAVYVYDAKDTAGNLIYLYPEDTKALEDEILEALHQDAEDRATCEADYRYDLYRENY